jgi:hypothetical protein
MNREGEDTGAESLPRSELSVAKGAKNKIREFECFRLLPNHLQIENEAW